MNIAVLEWLNLWLKSLASHRAAFGHFGFAEMDGCWDVVYMTEMESNVANCSDWEGMHTFIVGSIVIDGRSIQVIDTKGVIRSATLVEDQSAFTISSDSAHSIILRIEDRERNTATFSVTRVHAEQGVKYSCTLYYVRKRVSSTAIGLLGSK
jgi:hypothetical protein